MFIKSINKAIGQATKIALTLNIAIFVLATIIGVSVINSNPKIANNIISVSLVTTSKAAETVPTPYNDSGIIFDGCRLSKYESSGGPSNFFSACVKSILLTVIIIGVIVALIRLVVSGLAMVAPAGSTSAAYANLKNTITNLIIGLLLITGGWFAIDLINPAGKNAKLLEGLVKIDYSKIDYKANLLKLADLSTKDLILDTKFSGSSNSDVIQTKLTILNDKLSKECTKDAAGAYTPKTGQTAGQARDTCTSLETAIWVAENIAVPRSKKMNEGSVRKNSNIDSSFGYVTSQAGWNSNRSNYESIKQSISNTQSQVNQILDKCNMETASKTFLPVEKILTDLCNNEKLKFSQEIGLWGDALEFAYYYKSANGKIQNSFNDFNNGYYATACLAIVLEGTCKGFEDELKNSSGCKNYTPNCEYDPSTKKSTFETKLKNIFTNNNSAYVQYCDPLFADNGKLLAPGTNDQDQEESVCRAIASVVVPPLSRGIDKYGDVSVLSFDDGIAAEQVDSFCNMLAFTFSNTGKLNLSDINNTPDGADNVTGDCLRKTGTPEGSNITSNQYTTGWPKSTYYAR